MKPTKSQLKFIKFASQTLESLSDKYIRVWYKNTDTNASTVMWGLPISFVITQYELIIEDEEYSPETATSIILNTILSKKHIYAMKKNSIKVKVRIDHNFEIK